MMMCCFKISDVVAARTAQRWSFSGAAANVVVSHEFEMMCFREEEVLLGASRDNQLWRTRIVIRTGN